MWAKTSHARQVPGFAVLLPQEKNKKWNMRLHAPRIFSVGISGLVALRIEWSRCSIPCRTQPRPNLRTLLVVSQKFENRKFKRKFKNGIPAKCCTPSVLKYSASDRFKEKQVVLSLTRFRFLYQSLLAMNKLGNFWHTHPSIGSRLFTYF